MRRALLTLALLAACKTSSEATSSLSASAASTVDATRRSDTTEPAPVLERIEREGWAPLTITPGIGRLLPVGPQAVPLPRPATPSVAPDLAPDDGIDPRAGYAYFRETEFYGQGEKHTTVDEGVKGAEEASLAGQTDVKKETRPFGLFALLSVAWPYLLGALPILLLVFRKRLGPVLKLLPFPFSLLAPKE